MNVTVPLWTDSAGYCGSLPGYGEHVHRPNGLTPITLLSGQSLVFKYSIYHDVWAHPTFEALESCDYSHAVRVAGTAEGGGCEADSDLDYIDGKSGFQLTPLPGTLYLSCAVHDHCQNGQRVVVQTLPAPCEHEHAPPPRASVLAPVRHTLRAAARSRGTVSSGHFLRYSYDCSSSCGNLHLHAF